MPTHRYQATVTLQPDAEAILSVEFPDHGTAAVHEVDKPGPVDARVYHQAAEPLGIGCGPIGAGLDAGRDASGARRYASCIGPALAAITGPTATRPITQAPLAPEASGVATGTPVRRNGKPDTFIGEPLPFTPPSAAHMPLRHPLPAALSIRFVRCASMLLLLTATASLAQEQVTWARSITGFRGAFDGSVTNALAVDPWGNVAICSYGSTNATLPGGTGQLEVPLASGGGDMYVARYRANGEPAWGYSLGGPAFESAEGVAFDGQGNLYVAAWFASTFDIDPGPGETLLTPGDLPGEMDHVIAKFDSSGQFLHAIHLDAGAATYESLSMGFDAADNLYIGGSYLDGIDLLPGPDQLLLPPNGNNTVGFVAKYDPQGLLLDHMVLPASGNAEVMEILVEPDGSFVLAGHFGTSIDMDPSAGTLLLGEGGPRDMFARYNADFEVQWGRTIGTGDMQSQHVCKGLNGGTIICGHFRGQLNIPLVDGSTASHFYSWVENDYYLANLNADGEVVWFRPLPGSPSAEPIQGLSPQDDGTFFAELCYVELNLDEGASDFTLQTNGFPNYDRGLARYRMSDGAFLFGHGFTTTSGIEYGDLVTFPGTLYASGIYAGSIDVDLSDGTHVLTPGGLALVKYCERPNSVQSTVPGGALVLCPDQDSLIVLTGAEEFLWYDQPSGGEPLWTGDSLLVAWSADTVTYYVEGRNGECAASRLPIQVVPCGLVAIADGPLASPLVEVGPVPATDHIRVRLAMHGARIATAQLFDLAGRPQRATERVGAAAFTMDLQGLAAGGYVLHLVLDNGQRLSAHIRVLR